MLFSKFVFPNRSASRQSAFPRAGEEARARREAGTAPTLSISPTKLQNRALSARFQQEQGALLRTASGEGQEKGGETAGARQRCSTGGGDHLLPHKHSQFMHFSIPYNFSPRMGELLLHQNNQYASVLFGRDYLIALAWILPSAATRADLRTALHASSLCFSVEERFSVWTSQSNRK